MVIYFGKQMESAQVGAKVVPVVCEKCQCQYYYQLSRVGKGSATAPYMLGQASAAASAIRQADRDVQDRLDVEAELVPCPKCHWINQELIDGYRRGMYRSVLPWAFGIGLLGTVSSLIAAAIIYNGPAPDRGALPYFLFGGPLIFLSFAVVLILIRNYLRSLLRPNRRYPESPSLPFGTPPALLYNQEKEAFETAASSGGEMSTSDKVMDFHWGQDHFPNSCCVCSGERSEGQHYLLPAGKLTVLEVPRCSSCRKQMATNGFLIWLGGFFGTLAVAGIASLILQLDSLGAWFYWIASALFAMFAAYYFAVRYIAPARVLRVDKERGVIRLKFRNPDYQLPSRR